MNLWMSTRFVLSSVSFLCRGSISSSSKWIGKKGGSIGTITGGTGITARTKVVRPAQRYHYSSTKPGSTHATAKDDASEDGENGASGGEPLPPKNYVKTYRLQGETTTRGGHHSNSGVTVRTMDTGHVLQTDLPRQMGGRDEAPQPVEMLLAAWMGCTQATAVFVGRHMKPQRLLLERLVFDIQGERDERGALTLPIVASAEETTAGPPIPSRVSRITGTIQVYLKGGRSIEPSELHVLEKQTELRCPIANMMLASGCRIDVEWSDGTSSER